MGKPRRRKRPVERRGARQDSRLFLDEPAGRLLLFFRIEGEAELASHRRGRFWAFAIRAKRKGGQAIENKQFREMVHFAPPMISMACDRDAKRVVSLGEMNPIDFAGFPPGRSQNARTAKSTPPFALARRTLRDAAMDDPKWRRKPLKWLKTDSDMAPHRFMPRGRS
ncbi:MAG TPA: hypothetical protein VN637_05215 [Roseiarcus sp.]|nr:hypothetical protein [Roseiarcus sp.]